MPPVPKKKRDVDRKFLDVIVANERCLVASSSYVLKDPCWGKSTPAHLRTRGAGGGDHQAIVLCEGHHQKQGTMPLWEFAAIYLVNPWEEALRLIEKYCDVRVK